MLPLAHPSPQSKPHLDRFSHFCSAHGRLSSGMHGHVLSPINFPLRFTRSGLCRKNCALHRAIWTPSNTRFLWPTEVQIANDISIDSAVLHGSPQSALYFTKLPLPIRGSGSHLIMIHRANRAHNPNGISIRSAVFAQYTAKCPRTSQWAALSPTQNGPFSWQDLDPF